MMIPPDRRPARASRIHRQRRRRDIIRLMCEDLEERLMLDGAGGSTPSPIVVGRTLSAYTTGAVQNNQVTITYTVYNQQLDPETGVVLTTTLAPGVTLAGASGSPGQAGSSLSWDLGTIAGFERASVSLTVNLADASTTQLDAGAHATAMVDAAAVSASAPATTLRAGSVDPSLLASTPDANTTDPFIQAEAAALGYDPQQIFDFLHNEVGYNSYLGSVRGARGTLWSDAGNALDVASLGVALMRASGIPAQYVQGTLTQAQAQPLILSMFPETYQTKGVVPAGATTSDPANDAHLLSETEAHFWIRFDTGTGMEDADPLMPGASVGQAFTTAAGTFAEVPDALREKTEVTLTAEIYTQAAAAFGVGDGLSRNVVLDQTFNDVDLVGHPLTFGNFVTSNGAGFVIGAATHVYTPFVEVGDEAFPDPSHDETLTGTPYQEVLTNFPLGSQVLTGLTLGITLKGPEGPVASYERVLYDAIGYAARQGLVPVNLASGSGTAPSLNPADVWTLNVQPALQNPNVVAPLGNIAAALAQAQQALAADDPQAVALMQRLLTTLTRAFGVTYLADSDGYTRLITDASGVIAYADRPRLILTSAIVTPSGDGTTGNLTTSVDLRRDDVRVVPYPGQNVDAVPAFNAARGMLDSLAETVAIPPAGPPSASSGTSSATATVSSFTVAQAALAQGIPLVAIASANLLDLDALDISAEAKARITTAVQEGQIVFVPARSPIVDGKPTIAWYESDPTTGRTIGVTEDGGHQALNEWQTGLVVVGFIALYVLLVNGTLSTWIFNIQHPPKFAKPPDGGGKPTPLLQAVGNSFSFLVSQLKRFSSNPDFFTQGEANFKNSGMAGVKQNGIDPPLDGLLFGTPTPEDQGSNTETAVVTPAGVAAAGPATGNEQARGVQVSGTLAASWTSRAAVDFNAAGLNAAGATVRDAQGNVVGSGAVALVSGSDAVPVSITGTASVSASGTGYLAFYGLPGPAFGVSGLWDNVSANVTGNLTVTLTTAGLVVGGQTLPAGTYTITTASVSLTGRGTSGSTDLSGPATLQATGATVNLGPGNGSLSVAGNALDTGGGLTLTGYSGSLTVRAGSGGDGTDAVTLSGSATDFLAVSASPASVSAVQSQTLTVPVHLATGAGDTDTLYVQAPAGWIVDIAPDGTLTVTTAAGLQGGTYPIQIVAQSNTDADLVAQTTVNVTITPTQPGAAVSVVPDPLFSVPFQGALVPSAYQVKIANTGPVAETFDLAASTPSSGFTLLLSRTSVTVPAGQTALVGLYLQPTGPLPPPGTLVPFTVNVTCTTDASLSASQSPTFTVPAIDAVSITGARALSTTPGAPVTETVTLTNVGNVDESSVTLTSTQSPGLAVSGPGPVALAVGHSIIETVTLTPDASTPLSSVLGATLTVTSGPALAPVTQSLAVTVDVVVPGAAAIGTASTAATTLGETSLALQLHNLSTALTNLVRDPTSAVFNGQVLASLDAVSGLLGADPFLAPIVGTLASSRAAIAAATTPPAVLAAADTLGAALGTVGTTLSDEAQHNFTLALTPNSQVVQPQAPARFQAAIQNTGTQATTYDLSLAGLPAAVTGVLGQPTVTLDPGQGAFLAVTLTSTSASALDAFTFTLNAVAEGAPAIQQSVAGALAARGALVQVASVTTNPAFTPAGGQVGVSARILNAVNRQQAAKVSYTVADAGGHVLFTSTPVATTLNVLTTLTTVDLGTLDTTGFANGPVKITVDVADASGVPIAGATGQGSLFIGSPVIAVESTTPGDLPQGDGVVSNSLTVSASAPPSGSLGLVGQQSLAGAGGVARSGNLVYAAGSNGISVYDVTNPANPQLIRTVPLPFDPGADSRVLRVRGDRLVAALGGDDVTIAVYSLAAPQDPQLMGTSAPIPYNFLQDLDLTDTHAYIATAAFVYNSSNNDIYSHSGTLLSVDISDPTNPHLDGVLDNVNGTNNDGVGMADNIDQSGGNFNIWSIAQADPNTLLIGTTTVTGTDTQAGVGRVRVIDISDPAHMTEVGHVDIPGTVEAYGIAVDGTHALITASTGGFGDFSPEFAFTGDIVLATLDLTNPQAPQIIATQSLSRASRGLSHDTALGNNLFAFSSLGATADHPALFIVDAGNPDQVSTESIDVPAEINRLDGGGGLIETASASGVLVYQVGGVPGFGVTARVDIPTGTGVAVVPGSFNIAPTTIVSGAGFDTLEWDLTLGAGAPSRTLTWRTSVSGLQPGEARGVTLGGAVDFADQGASGTLTLPAQAVVGDQILGLNPPTQTVHPGDSARYTVTVKNPTASPVTYHLSVAGLPASWGTLASTVTVAAGGSADVPLVLQTDAFAATADYGFTVAAGTDAGARGSVQGDVVLQGQPAAPDAQAHGVVVALDRVEAAAGQGTAARYVVRVTNTGSAKDSFTLAVSGLPSGIAATLGDSTVALMPGADNFRDVVLLLTPAPGTPSGSVPFTVTATSASVPSVQGSASGTLDVRALGVKVTLSPSSAVPGSPFQEVVTNTGSVTDTFDLALGGPAALVASLGEARVTLAPGASKTVAIRTGATDFALSGPLDLMAVATSHLDPDVVAGASANIVVPRTQSLTAQFTPASQTLPRPGSTTFDLTVSNTGNIEDAYEVVMVGTLGPVAARLIGLDGLPTQTIPVIRLPGLGTGIVRLQADLLSALEEGRVTVMVKSLNNGSITAMATATVTASTSTPAAIRTSTVLTVAPLGPIAAGQPVTLTATVSSASGRTIPTGTITFVEGTDVLGTVTLDATGHATLTLATSQAGELAARATALGVGTHQIFAVYQPADASHAGSMSAASTVVVLPQAAPAADGPRVTSLLRYGYHAQPTVLVIRFDRALDPATAQDLKNYTVVKLGGPGRNGSRLGHVIRIGRAIYDPVTFTVILYPTARLDIHKRYALTIHGAQPGGVADISGHLLDGLSNGKAGSDFTGHITRQTLAGPATSAGTVPSRSAAFPAMDSLVVDLLVSSDELARGFRAGNRHNH